MNSLLIIGSITVTVALASYSIAVITEQVRKTISLTTLVFITSGIILDIAATAFMIAGSTNSPFTLHGFLGYSALAVMLTDSILIWKSYIENGINSKVGRALHLYSRYAFIWWILAFLTGAYIAMAKYM